MKASERLVTSRLRLRRPTYADAEAMLVRYAGDPDATRYMGWARHRSVADSNGFLAYSDAEWHQWPAGPYLIETHQGVLIGSTGLAFETPFRAMTGYILAKDAWGQGFATEALGAMVDLAPAVGVRRLYAVCHGEHRPSARVLEKCGFELEGTLRAYMQFPNIDAGLADVLCYARIFPS